MHLATTVANNKPETHIWDGLMADLAACGSWSGSWSNPDWLYDAYLSRYITIEIANMFVSVSDHFAVQRVCAHASQFGKYKQKTGQKM